MKIVPLIGAAALSGALFLQARAVLAVDLEITPEVYSRALANDNRRLRQDNPASVIGSISSVQVDARALGPTYSIALEPRGRFSRYNHETKLNADEVFVGLSGNKIYERNQLSARFDYERENTISTELEETGFFDSNTTRTSLSFAPSWSVSWTDQLATTLFGSIFSASFGDEAQTSFFDYNASSAGVNASYSTSARTSVSFSTSVSRFEVSDLGSKTLSVTYMFGLSHAFTDTLDVSFEFGQNRSELNFRESQVTITPTFPPRLVVQEVGVQERDAGQVINFELVKRFDETEYIVTWARSFSPSGRGVRQEAEEVDLLVEHRFTQRLRGLVDYGFARRKQEGGAEIRLRDLDMHNVRGRLVYRLDENWLFDVAYGFRLQSDRQTTRSASSNEVWFGIRYQGEPRIFPALLN